MELALVLPFVMLVLLGVLQVALLGLHKVTVAAAAREAARTAAVTGDFGKIREAAERAVPEDDSELDVTVTGERVPGEPVTVTVIGTTHPGVPIVSALFPDEVHMRAVVSMAVEVI